jgi:hypothetical protein
MHKVMNAIFVFQVASAFTTVGGRWKYNLNNGAQAKNAYWQTGSLAN